MSAEKILIDEGEPFSPSMIDDNPSLLSDNIDSEASSTIYKTEGYYTTKNMTSRKFEFEHSSEEKKVTRKRRRRRKVKISETDANSSLQGTPDAYLKIKLCLDGSREPAVVEKFELSSNASETGSRLERLRPDPISASPDALPKDAA